MPAGKGRIVMSQPRVRYHLFLAALGTLVLLQAMQAQAQQSGNSTSSLSVQNSSSSITLRAQDEYTGPLSRIVTDIPAWQYTNGAWLMQFSPGQLQSLGPSLGDQLTLLPDAASNAASNVLLDTAQWERNIFTAARNDPGVAIAAGVEVIGSFVAASGVPGLAELPELLLSEGIGGMKSSIDLTSPFSFGETALEKFGDSSDDFGLKGLGIALHGGAFTVKVGSSLNELAEEGAHISNPVSELWPFAPPEPFLPPLRLPTENVVTGTSSSVAEFSPFTTVDPNNVVIVDPQTPTITIEVVPNALNDGIETNGPTSIESILLPDSPSGDVPLVTDGSRNRALGSPKRSFLDKLVNGLQVGAEIVQVGAEMVQSFEQASQQTQGRQPLTQQLAANQQKAKDPCGNIKHNTIVYAIGCADSSTIIKPVTPTQPLLHNKTPATQPSGQGNTPPPLNCSGAVCCPPPDVPNPAVVACLKAPGFIPGTTIPISCDHPNGPGSYLPFCISK